MMSFLALIKVIIEMCITKIMKRRRDLMVIEIKSTRSEKRMKGTGMETETMEEVDIIMIVGKEVIEATTTKAPTVQIIKDNTKRSLHTMTKEVKVAEIITAEEVATIMLLWVKVRKVKIDIIRGIITIETIEVVMKMVKIIIKEMSLILPVTSMKPTKGKVVVIETTMTKTEGMDRNHEVVIESDKSEITEIGMVKTEVITKIETETKTKTKTTETIKEVVITDKVVITETDKPTSTMVVKDKIEETEIESKPVTSPRFRVTLTKKQRHKRIVKLERRTPIGLLQ